MSKQHQVTIDLVKGSKNKYIIRDVAGITIGRLFIIELLKENKYCSVRIKFYKNKEQSYEQLKDTLEIFIKTLFISMDINKINIIADEDINILPFVDLNFIFEGVISNAFILDNVFKDDFIFGIDYDTFKSQNINRNLILEGRRIKIKVLTPDKAEEVLNYYIRNREHLKNFEPSREESFYTLSVQKRSLIEGYKQFLNMTSINFGIYMNEKFIGKIQLSNIIMGVLKSAFVGYSIDKNEQAKGYMKESLNLVLQYAFNELGLHRIEASTLVSNIKSQKVLEGCGFSKLGINKKYLFVNGQWRDHIMFYKVNDK